MSQKKPEQKKKRQGRKWDLIDNIAWILFAVAILAAEDYIEQTWFGGTASLPMVLMIYLVLLGIGIVLHTALMPPLHRLLGKEMPQAEPQRHIADLTEAEVEELRKLKAQDEIRAVKRVRELTDAALLEAKQYVDKL